MHTIRYALRLLWKSPTFTLVAVLTLALCIGADTAIYSVVDAVLFRPLPFPHPERLALVIERQSGRGMSYEQTDQDGHTWQTLHDNVKSVDLAVFSDWSTGGVNLFSRSGAHYVQQQRVSAGFFRTLGVNPLLGREFSREEDLPNGPRVAVLSNALWRSTFHSDPAIVGSKILLRGEPYTVTGIMPPGFRTEGHADLWTPLRPSTTGEGSGTNYKVMARIRPGVTWQQADAEMRRIGQIIIAARHLPHDVSASMHLTPLQRGLTEEVRTPLLMLWAAVGLVLLIGCVNIASLLLARSVERSREIATRMALGGGKGAVVRQLLIESTLLGVLGGAAGIVLGVIALQGLKQMDLEALGISAESVVLDWRVLGVAVLTTLVTSLIFGLYPALQTVKLDILSSLTKGGGRTAAGARQFWARRLLVTFEIALGVVILMSAGLLLRTFAHLVSLPPGFDANQVMSATLSLQDARYSDGRKIQRLFRETLARISSFPGVEAAGIGLSLPYQRALNDGFKRPDSAHPDESIISNVTYVTPGYFEALRMSLLRGRRIDWHDGADSQPVAVVNEAFVRRYLADKPPLGLHLNTVDSDREIVGIIGDVQQSGSGWGDFGPLGAVPTIYIPASQVPSTYLELIHVWFSPSWVVRSSGSRQSVIGALQSAIAVVDSQLPFSRFKTMEEVRADAVAFQRVTATLLSVLAGLALLLAALGIYGLIANAVIERRRELGIRMALGATVIGGVKAVVTPALLLTIAGLLLGGIASMAATQFLRSVLWGVRPGDPLTLVAVCGVLLCFAVVASVIPGLRVARIDPAASLRDE